MIYHLDEIDNDSGEYLDIYYKRKNVTPGSATTTPEQGLYKVA
jgi:hypothetical protein